jgi:bacterioferritin
MKSSEHVDGAKRNWRNTRGKMYRAADGKASAKTDGKMQQSAFLKNVSETHSRIMKLTRNEEFYWRAADRALIVELLNATMANEIACTQRFRRHAYSFEVEPNNVSYHFHRLADEHFARACRLSERIQKLGGVAALTSEVAYVKRPATNAIGLGIERLIFSDDVTAARMIWEAYQVVQNCISDRDRQTYELVSEFACAQRLREVELRDLLKLSG